MTKPKRKIWSSPEHLAMFFRQIVPELGIIQPCVICDATGFVLGVKCNRCNGEGRLIEKCPSMTPLERDALLMKAQERM